MSGSKAKNKNLGNESRNSIGDSAFSLATDFCSSDIKTAKEFCENNKFDFGTAELAALQKYYKEEIKTPTVLELRILDKIRYSRGEGDKKIGFVELQSDNPYIKKALLKYRELEKKLGSCAPLTINGVANFSFKHAANTDNKTSAFSLFGNNYLRFQGAENRRNAVAVYSDISAGNREGERPVLIMAAESYLAGARPLKVSRRTYTSLSPDRENERATPFCLDATKLSLSSHGVGTVLNGKIKGSAESDLCFGVVDKDAIKQVKVQNGQLVVLFKPNSIKNENSNDVAWFKVLRKLYSEMPQIRAVFPLKGGIAEALTDNRIGADILFDKLSDRTGDLFYEQSLIYALGVIKKSAFKKTEAELKKVGLSVIIIGKTVGNPCLRILSKERNVVIPYGFLIDGVYGNSTNKAVIKEDFVKPETVKVTSSGVKKFVFDGVASTTSDFRAPYDFSLSGGAVFAPMGGTRQLTPTSVFGTVPVDTDSAVLSASANDISLENSCFMTAINSVVVSVAKLIASGASLNSIALHTAILQNESLNEVIRGKLLSTALGLFYAEHKLSIPAISSNVGCLEGNAEGFLHTTALGTAKVDTLVSNVFSKDRQIFLLRLRRDEYGMPDFKYLIKVLSLVNINIETKNIDAVAVAEGPIINTVVKSLAGEGKGITFKKIDSGFFNPTFGDLVVSINDVEPFCSLDSEYLGIIDDSGVIKDDNGLIFNQSELYKKMINVKDNGGKTYAEKDYIAKEFYIRDSAAVNKPAVLVPYLGDATAFQLSNAFCRAGGVSGVFPMKEADFQSEDFLLSLRKNIKNSQIIALGGIITADNDDYSQRLYGLFSNPIVLDALNELIFRRDGLVYGYGEGFRLLLDLGFITDGKFDASVIEAKRTQISKNAGFGNADFIARIRLKSNLSPWFYGVDAGTVTSIPIAGNFGRFQAKDAFIKSLFEKGQVATEFVDVDDSPTMTFPYNPTGSAMAVEALTSPDGRVLGRLGHSERNFGVVNSPDTFDSELFSRGVDFFRR